MPRQRKELSEMRNAHQFGWMRYGVLALVLTIGGPAESQAGPIMNAIRSGGGLGGGGLRSAFAQGASQGFPLIRQAGARGVGLAGQILQMIPGTGQAQSILGAVTGGLTGNWGAMLGGIGGAIAQAPQMTGGAGGMTTPAAQLPGGLGNQTSTPSSNLNGSTIQSPGLTNGVGTGGIVGSGGGGGIATSGP